jgi:DnaJ-class molecular chaperone
LRLKEHPDKNLDRAEEAQARFIEINQACERLIEIHERRAKASSDSASSSSTSSSSSGRSNSKQQQQRRKTHDTEL